MFEKHMKNRGRMAMNSRGQITLFIIMALLLVSGVLIYFLYVKPTYISPAPVSANVENCVQDAVNENLLLLEKQSGLENPEFYYLYQNDKIGYLCYTNSYYQACVNQNPFLKNNFERNLENSIREKVFQCYDNSISDLNNKGYNIQYSKKNMTVALEPNQINIRLTSDAQSTGEAGMQLNNIETSINSPLYDILMIATSIIQQETKFGDADISSIMLFYPDMVIDKLRQDDGTTIYIIQNLQSKDKFQFATRSYAWPVGYTGGQQ